MKQIIAGMLIISLIVLSIPNISLADTNNQDLKSTTITCYLDDQQKYEIFSVLYNDSELWISIDSIVTAFSVKKTTDGYYDKQDKVFYKFSTSSPNIVVERWIGSLEYKNTQHSSYSELEIDNTAWVPFTDSINLLERDLYIKDGFLHITEQHDTFLNLASREANSLSQKSFQLYDLYGDNTDTRLLAGSFASFWSDVLSTFGLSFIMGGEYENTRYTHEFMDLLVTSSSDELKTSTNEVKQVTDILSDKGAFSNALESVMKKADGDFNFALNELEKTVSNSEGDFRRNKDKLLKTMRNAVEEEGLASQIKELQGSITKYTSTVDVMTNAVDLLLYMDEYKHRDVFAVDAVDAFLSNVDNSALICQVSGAKDTILNDNNLMKANIAVYGVEKWLNDYINDEATRILNRSVIELFDAVDGGLILIGWDLANNFVPFLKNAFDDINHDSLIAFGSIMQNSTFELIKSLETKKIDEEIDENNLYLLAQTYYLYLKSCYVSRELALQVMRNNKIDEADPLFSQISEMNSTIVPQLSFIRGASSDLTDVSFYGRLPENLIENETEDIIEILHINSDDYKEVGKEHLLYNEVIESYKNAVEGKKHKIQNLNIYAINQYKIKENSRMGYVFYDIDHNGRDELLIGLERNGDIEFCDLCSYDISDNIINSPLYSAMDFNYLLKPSEPNGSLYPKLLLMADGALMVTWEGDGSIYKFDKDGLNLEAGSWDSAELDTIPESSLEWTWFADYSRVSEFTEEDLKETLCGNIDDNLIGWYYDDFYGDGVKEGFGIYNHSSVEVWMILQDGTYEQVFSCPGYVESKIITAGRQKYLVMENDGGDLATTSYLLGVDKQHNAREPFISGNYMKFYQNDDQYTAYLRGYQQGEYNYELVEFDYNEDNLEFEAKSGGDEFYEKEYMNFLESRGYELQIEIPEECHYLSGINFKYYTIVDIDSNGIPELIVAEGEDNSTNGGDGVSMIFQYQMGEINKLCCEGDAVESPMDVGLFHVGYYGPGWQKDLKTLSWSSGEGHGRSFYQLNGDHFIYYMDLSLLQDKSGYAQVFPETGIENVISIDEVHDIQSDNLEWLEIP